jgi:hypothetical protein
MEDTPMTSGDVDGTLDILDLWAGDGGDGSKCWLPF